MKKDTIKFINGTVGSGKSMYTLHLCAIGLLKKHLGFRYHFLSPITKKRLVNLVYDLLYSYYYDTED